MQLLLLNTDQLPVHLKAMRRQANLTQKDLAAKLQLSQSRLARMEANPEKIRVDQLMDLLNAIGVTIVFDVPMSGESATQTSGANTGTRTEW